ncbi:type II secretion system GspH family protein [bacterium]|nr:type II secretion system GspH family protein [bacterium]MCI0601953.1 type II secretion system GspH family protein [bacterium]
MNPHQKGSVYLVVLIVITILTILANFLFDYFQSHTRARKAHETYVTASQRATATMDIASSWLAAQQNPPEENLSASTSIRNDTPTISDLVKLISEGGVTANSFYWFSFNNDGNQDVGFVILPAGSHPSADCGAGYDPGCSSEHLYVVISRCRYLDNTLVEQKRYITKSFY